MLASEQRPLRWGHPPHERVHREALFHGTTSKGRRIPSEIRKAAVRKLDMVNAARELDELRVPPGNRLEALTGDRKGMHSIRVNSQWRIVFYWRDGDAHDVAIVDYHGGGTVLPTNRMPTHPGEVVSEEFLKPLRVTQAALAQHLGVPIQRINELVRGKRGVTPGTVWLLAGAFGTTPEFWVNLQTAYDLAATKPARPVTPLADAS